MWETEESKPVVQATFNAYDQNQIDLYSHALGYYLILTDIDNKLRNDYKYGKLALEYIQSLREYINELRSQYHLPED